MIDLAKTMQHVAIAGHAGPRELPPSVIEHGYDGLFQDESNDLPKTARASWDWSRP